MLMITTCLIWQGQVGAQAHSVVADATVGVKVGVAVTVAVGSGDGRGRVGEGIGVLVAVGSGAGDAGDRVAGMGALAAPAAQPAKKIKANKIIILKIA